MFFGKVMYMLFHMLSRCVMAFFKEQEYFNFMAVVTVCCDFGVQENKVCHCFHFSPIYLSWSDGTRCHDLCFLNWVLSQLFCSLLLPSIRGSLVPLHLLPLKWHHLHIWGCWYFCYDQCVLLIRLSLCPASFYIPRPNVPFPPGISWILLLYSNPLWGKRYIFSVLVPKDLVCLHSTIQLQLFSIRDWGIDLDCCNVEWFALEMDWDQDFCFNRNNLGLYVFFHFLGLGFYPHDNLFE